MLKWLRGNYPLLISTNINSSNGYAPASVLKNGIPLITAPDFSSGVVPIGGQIVVNSFIPDQWKRGYVQSWNLTLQKQLRGGWLAEAAYVGTRSVGQVGTLDRNAGSPGGGQPRQPFFGLYGRTAPTSQIVGLGNDKYDALQSKLGRRFASGYQVAFAYTFSKTLGIAGDQNNGSPLINLPQYYNLNRGLSNIDRTHNFEATGIAELPFGPGKRWPTHGFSSLLLRGWQANMLMSIYSGQPFNVTAPGTDLNAPGNTQRAALVKPTVQKLGGAGPGQCYYDPTAFAPVLAPRFGTAWFNILRGPGCFNTDVGLFRRFFVTERFSLQFRAESFNFTNTPKFALPNGNISNGNFMQISSTLGTGREGIDERVLRFGLRLGW